MRLRAISFNHTLGRLRRMRFDASEAGHDREACDWRNCIEALIYFIETHPTRRWGEPICIDEREQ